MVDQLDEVRQLRAQAAQLREEITVLRERLARLRIENAELGVRADPRRAGAEPWVTEWACEPSGARAL